MLSSRASCAALALFAFILPGLSSATENQDHIKQLLSQMSESVRTLDYRGLFTYEHGGTLSTLRVVHAVRDGVQYERLQHLSGPEREVLRQGRPVECLNPGDQLLQGRFDAFGDQFEGLETYYHFYIRGEERVAGRDVINIQVKPRDPFRYGFSLAIDKETGLPLKSLLIDAKMRVLERFQFIELELGPSIMESDYQAVTAKHRVVDHELSPCNQLAPAQPTGWQAKWLPGGFVFSGQQKTSQGQDMYMFTDGLTAFSVFVDSNDNPRQPDVKAQRGATVAYMHNLIRNRRAYQITVVGEIPPGTAQRVAYQMNPVGASPDATSPSARPAAVPEE